MSRVVIVGGGPAGIFAALSLKRKRRDVFLIEEEKVCGGLLGSFQNRDGVWFDYGSHFLRQTGVPEIDDLMYAEVHADPQRWQHLPNLTNGVYFAGHLNENTCFPDIRALPEPVYQKAVQEILHATPLSYEQSATNEEFILRSFGPTLYEHLYQPALKKFFSTELSDLAPKAHTFFDIDRVLAFTPETSREMKKSPAFDNRISFHSSTEGLAGLMNYYPATGGIGQWMELLVAKAQKAGVRILSGCRVDKLIHTNSKVDSVILSNGEQVGCSHLIWSVLPVPLLKASQLHFEMPKVKIKVVNLYYYVLDLPVKSRCQYVVSLDPNHKAFRTSLYSNFRSAPADKKIPAVCVEAIDDSVDTNAVHLPGILNELKSMNLIDAKAEATYSEFRSTRAGFPVFTNAYLKTMKDLNQFIGEKLTNCVLIGKGAGRSFFMNETLIDAHRSLTENPL